METFHKRVLLPLMVLFLVLTTVNNVSAQVPDGIISSLKTGNAKVLASYFNQNVELVILDNDNVYSKAQAEQILSEFFSRYKPEKFTIIHQGGKEGAQYVIGNLVTVVGNMTTKQEVFRVYFLLKKSADKDIIHQLRIEKQG